MKMPKTWTALGAIRLLALRTCAMEFSPRAPARAGRGSMYVWLFYSLSPGNRGRPKMLRRVGVRGTAPHQTIECPSVHLLIGGETLVCSPTAIQEMHTMHPPSLALSPSSWYILMGVHTSVMVSYSGSRPMKKPSEYLACRVSRSGRRLVAFLLRASMSTGDVLAPGRRGSCSV